MDFPGGATSKESACQCRRWKRCWVDLWADALEKEMATHSSILALKIPWIEEPGLLFIYFTYSNVYKPIPVSWFTTPQPLGNHVFLHLQLLFCFVNRISCTIFFKIPYISNITWYLAFCVLTYFTQVTVFKSIRVAANGTILFFLRLSNIPLYICTTSLSVPLLMDI